MAPGDQETTKATNPVPSGYDPGAFWHGMSSNGYLGGCWWTFDARHNEPRIGRVVMARGRDATDVAISTTFGPCALAGFRVVTEEVSAEDAPAARRRGEASDPVPDRAPGPGPARRGMAAG